jgi:hypothetical protein
MELLVKEATSLSLYGCRLVRGAGGDEVIVMFCDMMGFCTAAGGQTGAATVMVAERAAEILLGSSQSEQAVPAQGARQPALA